MRYFLDDMGNGLGILEKGLMVALDSLEARHQGATPQGQFQRNGRILEAVDKHRPGAVAGEQARTQARDDQFGKAARVRSPGVVEARTDHIGRQVTYQERRDCLRQRP